MRILLDENVCLRLAGALREDGHEVLAITESAGKGLPDHEVWSLARESGSLLISRDYHFTNGVQFDPGLCLGIVFLRHGNLKASEEVTLVRSFLSSHPLAEYQGKLVTLSPGSTRVRGDS
jgi:predicted nuclease of predicted toxin-antitoxin system